MIQQEQIRRYAELPLVVESEIGRCMLAVREVLALAPGSVVKLPVSSTARVQLLAGGAPFATGEVTRSGSAAAIRVVGFGKGKDR